MMKSKFSEISAGAFLSETQYYKVLSNDGINLRVKNERGLEMTISKGIIEEGLYTAHQYNEEILVSRTELIEIFNKVGDTVFAVNYNKQPKAEDINEAIKSANRGKILPIAEIEKLVKNAYRGEERTLLGYMIKNETGFGRSLVIDLEADSTKSTPEWDARTRQVDHRTLNFLIVKNKKYKVK